MSVLETVGAIRSVSTLLDHTTVPVSVGICWSIAHSAKVLQFTYTNCSLCEPEPFSLDVDECKDSNGGCHHLCTNTPGNFSCSCERGFKLLEDSLTCEGQLTTGMCQYLSCMCGAQ